MRAGLLAALGLLLLVGLVLWLALDGRDPAAVAVSAPQEELTPPVVELEEPVAEAEQTSPARVELLEPAPEPAAVARNEDEPEPVAASRYWARLVDQGTGLGIAQALVRPRWSGGEGEDSPELRTDEEGYVELPLIDGEAPAQDCAPEGYGPIVFKPVEGHATRELAQDLGLTPAARWSVQVLDAGGVPLEGVRLSLEARAYQLMRPAGESRFFGSGIRRTETTDASGRAEFTGLPAEVALELVVTWERQSMPQPEDLVLAPGEHRSDVLRPFGQASILVRVRDQVGGPLAGQRLWLVPDTRAGVDSGALLGLSPSREGEVLQRIRTDELGLAVFEDVPVGSWCVGVAPPSRDRGRAERQLEALDSGASLALIDGAVAPVGRCLRVEPGALELELELEAHRGLFITGSVRGAEDRMGRVSVRARTEVFQAYLNARPTKGGRFILGPLMDGDYMLSAGTRISAGKEGGVLVRAGERNVVLDLIEGGGFSGNIVDDATGEPAQGVVLVWGHAPVFHLSMGMLGMGGSDEFSQEGLGVDTYDVTVRTQDGRIGSLRGIQVRAGETLEDLEVRVKPGAKLRIRYEGPSEYANYSVFDGETVVAANGLHRGTLELEIVPATRLRVELDAHGAGEHQRELRLSPGELGEVEFDLR